MTKIKKRRRVIDILIEDYTGFDPHIPLLAALHKKSWAVIDRPYSLEFATVGALYERPRCIFCAKPLLAEEGNELALQTKQKGGTVAGKSV